MSIYRPYIDPDLLAETPDDIEDAKMYESIARSIIKTITGGFSFERQTIETLGLGTDYLSLPYRLNKILKITENGLVIYDKLDPNFVNTAEFFITPDRSNIGIVSTELWKRSRSRSVTPQLPASDSYTLFNTNDSPNIVQNVHGTPTFPDGWTYTIEAEVGWPLIPEDIKIATRLLVNDLRSNNLPYINAYIKDYKSEQFSLSFDPSAFGDTGNRIVDKILANYPRVVFHAGVL